MPSGGARARSGPGADPASLRSASKSWVDLPERFEGNVPKFPLAGVSPAERKLWHELWRMPQASEWSRLGLKFQVAAYVRAFLESVEPGCSATLKTSVQRMEDTLGISPSALNSLRWRIRRVDDAAQDRKSIGGRSRARLKVIEGDG